MPNLMEDLMTWLTSQLEDKKIEPNSILGQAISFMLKHFKGITLFLRVPKAPIDNNLCEQVLKKAIFHRKNSLFYKTTHGAYIREPFMNIIRTCSLCRANHFKYLKPCRRISFRLLKNQENGCPGITRKCSNLKLNNLSRS